jgi:hypothetical protein
MTYIKAPRPTYVEDCAVEFLMSSVDLKDIEKELDGRSIRAALSTAGIRLKEHFKDLDLVKGAAVDLEALKKRLMVRHSWGSPILVSW